MKKLIIAGAGAVGLAAAAAIIKLALPSKPYSGSNAHLSSTPATPAAPSDELVAAANKFLRSSDKVVDASGAFATRTAEGGLVLYGQVTSSSAAGMLRRRVKAMDPDTEVESRLKVAKRA